MNNLNSNILYKYLFTKVMPYSKNFRIEIFFITIIKLIVNLPKQKMMLPDEYIIIFEKN